MSRQPEQPGEILVSDADRERLAAALGEHHAAGRLTLAEHERRVAAVLEATTLEQATAALEGLPPLPARAARRVRSPGHGEANAPGAAWVPTAERFRDPTSGQVTRVWVDPVSGTRHYVADN